MPLAEDALMRVPAHLVAESEAILHPLGLSADEAVRLFLAQVSLRRGLPFTVTLPPGDSEDDLLASATMRQATMDSFYDDEPPYDPADACWKVRGAAAVGWRFRSRSRILPLLLLAATVARPFLNYFVFMRFRLRLGLCLQMNWAVASGHTC